MVPPHPGSMNYRDTSYRPKLCYLRVSSCGVKCKPNQKVNGCSHDAGATNTIGKPLLELKASMASYHW